ncbi:ATP-dependent helicase HrpB [Pseudomonadota bacterium]
MTLPIHDVLPELHRALNHHPNVVLQAPPGAGKTTCVPLAMLEAAWLKDQKIIMLEPRRLAARAAARFMAQSLGEKVGETVGYRVRMDSRVGPKTRIEVVTEGVLTRLLQQDPELPGVGLVIFDEFHERSLQADLGLALCLESQSVLREELKLLVMSATLDGDAIAVLLGGAPVVTSEGRCFPVDIEFSESSVRGRREDVPAQVVSSILRVLKEDSGSLLVFLPGAREIKYVERQLAAHNLGGDVIVAPLYGALSQEQQDIAIAPMVSDKRKVVLATNIAETSLTIEGIRIVIDSGLMREPRFDPGSGMTRLETIFIPNSSAEQRAGRAGRIEAGRCIRLWSSGRHLVPFATAEIESADLAPLALELAQWGVKAPEELAWLTLPPKGAYAQALELLRRLGAVDASACITEHGRKMAALPMHPRLAHMILKGAAAGVGALACDVAALLGERDVLPRISDEGVDLYARVRLLNEPRPRSNIKRIQQTASRWRRQLAIKASNKDETSMLGVLLAWAYPDRIGRARSARSHQFLLSNGRGASLPERDPLVGKGYIVAAELDGADSNAKVFLAATVSHDELCEYFAGDIELVESLHWDKKRECVLASQQTRLGALVLAESSLGSPDAEQVVSAMLSGVRNMGLDVLPWDKASRSWRQRVQFLHSIDPECWPDVSDASLLFSLDEWLGPFLNGMTRKEHLQKLDLQAALNALLPWDQQQKLDELAPTHMVVPTGSRIALDYSNHPPVLAVRLQEVFGLADTPRVAGGKVTLLLHLLSPARRPMQVTQDLGGFWQGSYAEVKKDMKGRYPKHYWPDDPLQAEPTRRAKPRG